MKWFPLCVREREIGTWRCSENCPMANSAAFLTAFSSSRTPENKQDNPLTPTHTRTHTLTHTQTTPTPSLTHLYKLSAVELEGG